MINTKDVNLAAVLGRTTWSDEDTGDDLKGTSNTRSWVIVLLPPLECQSQHQIMKNNVLAVDQDGRG